MKYDSLNYQQRQKLEDAYAARILPPKSPGEYDDPVTTPAAIVMGQGSGKRIIVEPAVDRGSRYQEHDRECLGRMTVLNGASATVIELRIEDLTALRDQLNVQIEQIQRINAAREAHRRALVVYRTTAELYKERMERDIRRTLDVGNITGAMIDDPDQRAKIRFDGGRE